MLTKLHFKTLLLAATLVAYAQANTVKTCYSCRGVNCERTTLSETQQCVDALDYCVTVYDNANVKYKGCSLQIPVELRKRCDANMGNCHRCNTDRCNNVGAMEYSCLQCDSSTDTNCARNPTVIKPTRCSAPTTANSYCFVKSTGSGGVQRGCATSLTDQTDCFADNSCFLCSPGDIHGCNNIDFVTSSRFNRFLN